MSVSDKKGAEIRLAMSAEKEIIGHGTVLSPKMNNYIYGNGTDLIPDTNHVPTANSNSNKIAANNKEIFSAGWKGHVYITKPGDSLRKIAMDFYNDGAKWQLLYSYNYEKIGKNPDVIRPNLSIFIPVKAYSGERKTSSKANSIRQLQEYIFYVKEQMGNSASGASLIVETGLPKIKDLLNEAFPYYKKQTSSFMDYVRSQEKAYSMLDNILTFARIIFLLQVRDRLFDYINFYLLQQNSKILQQIKACKNNLGFGNKSMSEYTSFVQEVLKSTYKKTRLEPANQKTVEHIVLLESKMALKALNITPRNEHLIRFSSFSAITVLNLTHIYNYVNGTPHEEELKNYNLEKISSMLGSDIFSMQTTLVGYIRSLKLPFYIKMVVNAAHVGAQWLSATGVIDMLFERLPYQFPSIEKMIAELMDALENNTAYYVMPYWTPLTENFRYDARR